MKRYWNSWTLVKLKLLPYERQCHVNEKRSQASRTAAARYNNMVPVPQVFFFFLLISLILFNEYIAPIHWIKNIIVWVYN